MKKIIVFIVLCISGLMCHSLFAQNRVNIVNQPIWGPVGYDYVDYYYIPEIDSYYNVPRREFIYMENGRWVNRSSLPRRYKGYDMYGASKYVINEPKPYLKHNQFKEKYKPLGNNSRQHSIRDSKDQKYFVHKNHPEHSNWKSRNKKGKSNNANKNNRGRR
jgi:hypothetical protein